MNAPKKILAGIATTALIGMAGLAFAHGGWGNGYADGGYGHMMGRGYGHMMGGGGFGHMGPGFHMFADNDRGFAGLTDEQQEKLTESRDAFFRATEALRNDVYQKRGELSRELNRDNPNAGKVEALQKELSGLEGQFDQKRLAHQLELKKIAPELTRGLGGRAMGNNFGGYCWN